MDELILQLAGCEASGASANVRYQDARGNVATFRIPDPWKLLEQLEARYPPPANPARDRRFDDVMRARKLALQCSPSNRTGRASR